MKIRLRLIELKVLSIWFLFAMNSSSVSSQTFSQYSFSYDTANYVILNSANATYLTNGDDEVSTMNPIGFTFTFHGTNYTDFSASSNGFIQLGSAAINPFGSYNNELSSTIFNPVIAPLWDDLVTTDSVWYQLTGVAPNRILTIEWKQVQWDFQAVDSNFSFAINLFETTNKIDFIYNSEGSVNNPSASIGMNFPTADWISVTPGFTGINPTISTTIANNLVTDFPGNGLGFRYTFYPPLGDFSPPTISNMSVVPTPICTPIPLNINVTLSDVESGVSNAVLWYKVNGSPFLNAPFNLISGDSINGNYMATMPAQVAGSVVEYYIQAADFASNTINFETKVFSYSALYVDAGNNQTIFTGNTATISANVSSIFDNNIKISEIVLFRDGIGTTPVYPAYIDSLAQDFIEITNLNPQKVNLSGYYIQVYDTLGLITEYTFPSTFSLDSNAVAIIHLGIGTDNIAANYYHTGGVENALYSAISAGFVIKDFQGNVLDAIAVNNFVFPIISNVTNADWMGNVASSLGRAGVLRNNIDNNTATNWNVSAANNEMTLGVINPGLFANANSVSIVWNPGGATSSSFTTPALINTTTYNITVTNGVCTVNDSVTINVVIPTTPVAGFYASPNSTFVNSTVNLIDTSLYIPDSWNWTITPGTFVFINGTSATSQNPQIQFTQTGLYTVALSVSNFLGIDSITKVDYVIVNDNYCIPNYIIGTKLGDYIKGVRIGTLNNWPTVNDSLAYHDYYDTKGTVLLAANTYTLAILNGQFNNEFIAAWIDYNNNGVFENSEKLGTVHAIDSLKTYTIVFTTPLAIANGSYRMRIRMARQIPIIDPCLDYNRGETEDYRIDFASCALPIVVNLGNDTTICGVPFALSLNAGNPGNSYVWQDGMNTQMITANVNSTYTVDVTNLNGCHGRDSVIVNAIAYPAASFNYSANNVVITFTNASTNATTYFWTFGDGNTSTLASPSHTFATTGNYIVTLTATNSCGIDSQQIQLTVTNVGIDDFRLKNTKVSVAPNPSDGLFSIIFELLTPANTKIEIYNFFGAKVVMVEFGKLSGKQKLNLNISDLPKGVYLLKLISDNSTNSKLILIQ